MSENSYTSETLSETWHLLNELQYEKVYTHIWFSLDRCGDRMYNPTPYAKTTDDIVTTLRKARVVLPDSVLKKVEEYNSKIKASLLKIRELYDTLADGSPVLINPEMIVDCEELRKESFKLGNDVGFLGIHLREEVIETALRAHFPSMKEESQ